MTSREYRYHRYKKQHRNWLLDWDIPLKKSPNDRICEDERCSHYATTKCVLDYQDEISGEWKEEVIWLCAEHAEEGGYCMCCGTFIAGTGMEFRNNGYCDNCHDQIHEDDFYDGSLDY